MILMSRLEEIKEKVNSDFEATKKVVHVVDGVELEDMNFAIEYKHIKWLINRVDELEYASKYNGELNEFLQKRKLPAKSLGSHVVDVVMNHVEELEEAMKGAHKIARVQAFNIKELKEANEALAETRKLDAEENVRLWEENQRYKEALEEVNAVRYIPHEIEKIVNQALAGDNS